MSSVNPAPPRILSTGFIKKLSSSTFNYWAGYVANVTLVAWLLSQAFTANWTSLFGPGQWAVAFGGGMALWTFGEYALHRYLYHEVSSVLQVGHQLHHDEPKALLGVPWYLTTFVIVGIFYGLSHFFAAAWVGTLMGFFWLGYIGYCAVHHSIHHHNFKNPLWKSVRRHHFVHHAKHDVNWGITVDVWDRVFRTKG